jgi:hypothetical protein
VPRAKVFGIGFHKTGTKSLAAALRQLGYRTTGPNGTRDPTIRDTYLELAVELSGQYDAFQDNPWPLVYREMDALHAGSRFILTVRPAAEWIGAAIRHFGLNTTPMRELIYGYGSPVGHEDHYCRVYQRHIDGVLHYFRRRPDDLLVMRITEGDDWEKLCPFLGSATPPGPFPHVKPAPAARRPSTPVAK